MDTMVSFRTDSDLKKEATKIYESLGMNLSVAINLFLKQTVIRKEFPCSLELDVSKGIKATYPNGFFELFGSGKNLGLDEEPKELSFENDTREAV